MWPKKHHSLPDMALYGPQLINPHKGAKSSAKATGMALEGI